MTFVWIALVQVTAAVGLVTCPVPGRALCLMAGALTWIGGLGTIVCYHRAPAHRALRLRPVVREIVTFSALDNGSGWPRRYGGRAPSVTHLVAT